MTGLIAEGENALSSAAAWLSPIAGPPQPAFQLVDLPGGLTLGRGDTAQLRLPLTADKVSRAHCRFTFSHGVWSVADASKWGTYLNGIRLQSGQPVSLREGDTLRIVPWTFAFTALEPKPRGHDLLEDTATNAQEIRSVDDESARALAGNLMELLQQSTEFLHAAKNEKELAEALLDIAVRGTGLPNAAVLKVVDAAGRVEPIAIRKAGGQGTTASEAAGGNAAEGRGVGGEQLYSRSLVARARQGQVAELRVETMSGNIGDSVLQMKISAAICAPLVIGDGSLAPNERDVAALLYLDARAVGGAAHRATVTGAGTPAARPHPNAAGFAMAIARIASLALANLKRLDMAVRMKETELEMGHGHQVQQSIFPSREGKLCGFSYVGQSVPGQSVGGDFFDVIPVGERRLAVALGDVTGKGVPASVLMAASFGFLHALLQPGTEPAKAAGMLTRFLHPRRNASRFVTLWLGIFDLDQRELCYVDCGHGWAALQHADGTFQSLDDGGGLPCGIDDEADYTCVRVPLPPGSRAIIVSDGFTEQFGVTLDPATGKPANDQFGMSGIHRALASKLLPNAPGSPHAADGVDELKSLYNALTAFAGTSRLADDATAILVKWE